LALMSDYMEENALPQATPEGEVAV